MSPRDPADLARVAPDALALVGLVDALYALLEEVEEGEIRTATVKHARACWERVTWNENNTPQDQLIDKFKRPRMGRPPKKPRVIYGEEHWHCPCCNTWKPGDDFGRSKSSVNGLDSWCLDCRRAG